MFPIISNGESEMTDIDDISKALAIYSPGAQWNGSNYTNPDDITINTMEDAIFMNLKRFFMQKYNFYAKPQCILLLLV